MVPKIGDFDHDENIETPVQDKGTDERRRYAGVKQAL